MKWLTACLPLLALAAAAYACDRDAVSQLPFIGCPADVQGSREAPPPGGQKALPVQSAVADRLAFYESAYDYGVVAPRGWNCVALVGSSGMMLIVTPSADDAKALIQVPRVPGLGGPAVIFKFLYDDTSGRFPVAGYAARYFSGERTDLVQGVIAEGILPKEEILPPTFPDDRIAYRSKRTLEFATPAGSDGLGSYGTELVKGALPIRGLVMLSDHGLVILAARLTADTSGLYQPIASYVETCNMTSDDAKPATECPKDLPRFKK